MEHTYIGTLPENWEPEYDKWRHGGWYVSNISYPSGAIGCVSNNYPDKKWRIVCDPSETPFQTRDAAARAERVVTVMMAEKPAGTTEG